jgi:hypothetical protein
MSGSNQGGTTRGTAPKKEYDEDKKPFGGKVDESVEQFVMKKLMPFHGELSLANMEIQDPAFDLANEKIAQAMTVLQTRNKKRRKEKTYGDV